MNCKRKLLIVCKQASEVINKEKYSPLNLSITAIMSQKKVYYGINLTSAEEPLRGILPWLQAEVLTHILVTC